MMPADQLPFLSHIEDLTLEPEIRDTICRTLDALAIPKGCLGQLHDLAKQICFIQHTARPRMERALVLVFAGDHGISNKGVSAFPKRATFENFRNMLAGRTVISAFAEAVGVPVWYVDAGIDGPRISDSAANGCRFIDARIGNGTADCSERPAMTRQQAMEGLTAGYQLAQEASKNADAIILGEMGIANTSIASLVSAAYLDLNLNSVIGRGSGLSDQGLMRKRAVLAQAFSRHSWNQLDKIDILAELSGHEVNALVGAVLGAAARKKLVLIDGFIVSVAALVAVKLMPACQHYLVPCTESAEFGYQEIAKHLSWNPLLRLGLRLGEGSGAALAWPIVRAAAMFPSAVFPVDQLGWLVDSSGNKGDGR